MQPANSFICFLARSVRREVEEGRVSCSGVIVPSLGRAVAKNAANVGDCVMSYFAKSAAKC